MTEVSLNDGRDAEQVEQVHGNRNAYHIGYEYKVSVAMRLIGAVFPLENEPKDESRA